jgi:arylsulfate sulfotransferase
MIAMNIKYFFPGMKRILLLASLVCLIYACRKQHTDLTTESRTTQKMLERMADSGLLLNSYVLEGAAYLFRFETADVRIPAENIQHISEDKSRWKTTVTLGDGTVLTVPSKGEGLDFIVKDLTLNPTGFNPLAAMVDVWLPVAGRVKVTVQGKEGTTGTLSHLCQSLTARQQVPVFGLYAGYNNTVMLTFTDKNGNERGSTSIHIKTDPLSIQNFPMPKTITAQPQKMEPGLNLVSYPGESELDISCPYMVDADGEIRWILLLKNSPDLQRFGASIGLKRMKNGNFLSGDGQLHRIVEMDMFGKLVRQWDLAKLGYIFHHEVTEATNGNFLITVSKSAARLVNGMPRINDHIIELNPTSGAVVKEWDLAKMLDTSRYQKPDGITPPAFAQSPGNWVHNNSITELGDDLLMTMRYQGLASFSWSGSLRWIISPHRGWSEPYRKYLLQPIAENGALVTDARVIAGEVAAPGFDWAWGPHTPVSLPNGNILVFDNGLDRQFVPNAQTANYSRVVEYHVDASKGTVQQVWSYGQSRGLQGFSQALSSVQYLKQTGHIMFCPGMGVTTSKGYGGRVVEIDPLTKAIIFEMEITAPSNTAFHRVTRISLYPDNI